MMNEELTALQELEEAKKILDSAGIRPDQEAWRRLAVYHAMLLEWNGRMDLTNVPRQEMALRHYGDSLLPLACEGWFPPDARLIDVGSGAGFPGMPLAIVRPDLRVTLLDAQRKRCDFLQAVVGQAGLRNVTVIHGRAEDAARGDLRESMDIAAARAVAPLNVLLEYLLPFVRQGGRALCWKGPAVMEERDAGGRTARMLGGREDTLVRLPIPEREHYVLSYRKTGKTADPYPRKSGIPSRQPLAR